MHQVIKLTATAFGKESGLYSYLKFVVKTIQKKVERKHIPLFSFVAGISCFKPTPAHRLVISLCVSCLHLMNLTENIYSK